MTNKAAWLIGAAAGAFVLPASAQIADAEPEQSAEIDTITVTARRKDETLIETPVAVSAFSDADIENLQLLTVDDVARFTPGLSFSKAFGRATERPVIRGQSNVLAGVQFGVESGTAYFVDGVYFPGSIQNLDPNELQRVEVVKGPQSALYGRNTYAGAINFITKGGSDTFEGNTNIRVGNNDTIDAAISLAGPILPSLTGRITARHYEYGGEFRNQVTEELVGDEKTFSIAGVLDFEPNDTFNSRLRLNYNKDEDGPLPIFFQDASENNCEPGYRSLSSIRFVPGFNGVPFPAQAYDNQNQYYCGVIEPGQVALNTGPDADGVPNVIPGALQGTTFIPPIYGLADGTAFDGIEREQTLLSWVNSLDFDNGYKIEMLAGYRDEQLKQGYDSDHSPVNWFISGPNNEPFFANTTLDEIQDYSVEVKLSSPTDRRLRWLIGAYYFEQDIEDRDITFADPDASEPENFQGTRGIENQAVFAYVEYDITEALSLTVEGRYAEEFKTDSLSPIGEAEFDNFTPRVTLDYDLANGGVVYALYAEGVKPGGLNGLQGFQVGNPSYEQESSKNYELGLKMPVTSGLFFTSAVFFTDATDVQLTTALETPAGALNSIATNQGSGEVFGFELQLGGSLNDYFSTSLNYAFVDTEFTSGCDPDEWILTSGGGVLTDPANQTGTDFTADFTGAGPASCSIEGREFPLTSRHQASGFLRYDLPGVGPLGSGFFASADVSYESSKFVQVHNRAETGDATIFGGRVGFEHDSWTLSAYGQNLNDEQSAAMATRWLQTPYFFANINTAPEGASTSAPRGFFGALRRGPQYGVELRYRF